ncbi:hypothetical protein F2Q69_00037382 [Brassica cretica]|uniref:Uncharacterized protein n=1 Tax=Brassica cretica TaxID=69181 RepID=A0A8S9SQI8_BRACR|nr:hypothetical protein F2Q69_00037382 [Brassica cretica]
MRLPELDVVKITSQPLRWNQITLSRHCLEIISVKFRSWQSRDLYLGRLCLLHLKEIVEPKRKRINKRLPPSRPHASKDGPQLRACRKRYKRSKPAHFSASS